MKRGERFENECFEYLKTNLEKIGVEFELTDTADSTVSDICVRDSSSNHFFIEVKDYKAQSGQFVIQDNISKKQFQYSKRNKSESNSITENIIKHINKHYDTFSKVNTAGVNIDLDEQLFSKWIVDYYRNKNVKYFMSKYPNNEYVIIPLEKFNEYFKISANVRVKKSGSRSLSKLKNLLVSKFFEGDGDIKQVQLVNAKSKNFKNKLFVHAPEEFSKTTFTIDSHEFYFSPQSDANLFEIRELSKTRNKNVIFSIELIKTQDLNDLKRFQDEFLLT